MIPDSVDSARHHTAANRSRSHSIDLLLGDFCRCSASQLFGGGRTKMVADQDPDSPQQLTQTPLMAVRLGSAHFGDVMIGFPNRGVDGWWECPTVIKVGKITQPWTLSSSRFPVENTNTSRAPRASPCPKRWQKPSQSLGAPESRNP